MGKKNAYGETEPEADNLVTPLMKQIDKAVVGCGKFAKIMRYYIWKYKKAKKGGDQYENCQVRADNPCRYCQQSFRYYQKRTYHEKKCKFRESA